MLVKCQLGADVRCRVLRGRWGGCCSLSEILDLGAGHFLIAMSTAHLPKPKRRRILPTSPYALLVFD